MPTYKITDPATGLTLRLTGDSAPTEQELTEIFAKTAASRKPEGYEGGTTTGKGATGDFSETPASQIKQGIAQGIRQGMPFGLGNLPQSKPELAQFLKQGRPALETAGMMGGGALAGAGSLGMASVLGAGLGYGATKTALDAAERWAQDKPQPGIAESAKRAAGDVATGATYEMGGQALGNVAGRIIPRVGAATSASRQSLADQYRRAGVESFTPADVANSKTLSLLEGYLNYSPGSGDKMAQRAAAKLEELSRARDTLVRAGAPQEQIEIVGNRLRNEAKTIIERNSQYPKDKIDALVNDFVGKIGESEGAYASGGELASQVKNAFAAKRASVSELYNAAERAGGEALKKGIETPQTTEVARRLLSEEIAKPPATRDNSLISTLQDFLPKKVPPPQSSIILTDAPPAVPKTEAPAYAWEGLKKAKTDFASESARIKSGNATKGTTDSRALDMLSEAIDNDMHTYSQSVGGEFGKQYNAARVAARDMHETFSPELMKTIGKNPEDIVHAVTRGGEVTLLKKIADTTGELGLAPVRQEFIRESLQKSVDKSGNFSPEKFSKSVASLGGDGTGILFNAEHKSALEGLANSAEQINAKFAGKGSRKTVEFLNTIANSSPDKVVDFIFKPENIGNIKLAKKLLPPQLVDQIETAAVAKVLQTKPSVSVTTRGLTPGDKYLPVTSANNFGRYKTVLKELLPAERFGKMEDLIVLGQHMSNVEKLALNASQTAQTNNIMSLMQKGVKHFAKADIINNIAAKMYLNPATRNYILRSSMANPQDPQAIAMFTKGLTVLANDTLGENK